MAIKIEFYQLITPVHIAKKYFPKQYENESCWNDGVICTPMGAMNSFDINSIIRECEKLGLRRFKEENGERIIGDYYIGTQSGLDDTFQYKKSNWIRVHNGVAWNPYLPYGKNIPIKFPCFYGGFYYESKQVWEESKTALLCFNDILDKYNLKRQPIKEENLLSEIISSIPEKTPYDNFFYKLSQRTLEQEFSNETPQYLSLEEELLQSSNLDFASATPLCKTEEAERLLNLVIERKIDITQIYNDWIKIGLVIKNLFGEKGLDLFLNVSSFYPNYCQEEAENKYFELNEKRYRANTQSLFDIAAKYGIHR